MSTIEIFHPAGQSQKVAPVQLNEISSLEGRRLAILENGKPNFNRLATLLADRLGASHGLRFAGVYRKENPAVGATPQQLDEIARSADLVLTGSAD